ncbi:MAG: sugar transferase, partial [Actinomycetales bacterium]|nr:sugar transferase [Actinomycetales bacterium]
MNTRRWRAAYGRRLVITDALVICWSVFGVQLAWFSTGNAYLDFAGDFSAINVSYYLASIVIILLWLALLAGTGSRKIETVGGGPDEYRRVSSASFMLFAVLSAVAFLFQVQLARGYVLIALPLGLFLLLLSRWLWRQWLRAQRLHGQYLANAVIVGSAVSMDFIAKKILDNPEAGFIVRGAFLSRHSLPVLSSSPEVLGESRVPVLGSLAEAVEGMRRIGADTLIVASADDLSPHAVRQLGWELNPGLETLVVASNILDVSGPRLHIHPVAGLPLILIETPKISGFSLTLKRVLDILASLASIILLSPLFVIIVLVIKCTSSGSVFFLQERVGHQGVAFTMAKFRTMYSDAAVLPSSVDEVSPSDGPGNEVLFKRKHDPRITRPGTWLRRHSIDELPQIFNVLVGDMSLVGPRPPLASEVAKYDDHVRRKFLAKPGMTGLWQVSGRSDLTWEESVRADLMYVENWSLITDLIIIWRTIQVVITGRG